jgi:hypothetical protein
MAFDPDRFGKTVAAVIKEQIAPLKAVNEKLLADNAGLIARLASIESEQKLLAGGLASVTVRGAIIDREGRLVLTFGDGGTKDIGIVVGRDADAAQIKAAVIADVLAALPKPKDGDGIIAEDLRGMVASLVDVEVQKRMQALPTVKTLTPEDVRPMLASLVDDAVSRLPAPQPGRSADPAETQRMVDEAVTKAVAAIPAPRDGNSVTPEDVRPMLASLVDDAVSCLPAPQPGKSADPAETQRMVDEAVTKAVAAIPAPRDGNSVTAEDVRPMLDELVQKRLDAIHIPDPAPGVSEALVDQDGQLVLTRTDGHVIKAGRVRGADGIGADDLELQSDDGGRTLRVMLKCGARTIEREIRTAVVIDRGIWRAGDYKAGDAVTLKGSWWVAGRDTSQRPGEDNSGWRLAVKRGSDTRGPSRTRGRAA